MDHDGILRVLAPCGLNCAKCLAYFAANRNAPRYEQESR